MTQHVSRTDLLGGRRLTGGPTRRVAVVSSTRADYGLLYCVMKEIQRRKAFTLQVILTGAHLATGFGETWRQVEHDGFPIAAKVEILLASDTRIGSAKSAAVAMGSFADEFSRLGPDIVVLLGDRYEIFAIAATATLLGLPIAHIGGGDTTEGAFDEAFRHSITKMAHLHFVTNSEAARRVRQLGEDKHRIFQVGSPGVDYITRLERIPPDTLADELGIRLMPTNLLITYHPTTIGGAGTEQEIGELLAGLEKFPEDVGLIFTMPNFDPAGGVISERVREFCAKRSNASAFVSLGPQRYLSLMSHCDAVVGNSSSGLAEAPSFGVPTVNIGHRQKGRLMGDSVVSAPAQADAIYAAIRTALSMDCSNARNPYGGGDASVQIADVLERELDFSKLTLKRFVDWED